jgi:competence protein ComEC
MLLRCWLLASALLLLPLAARADKPRGLTVTFIDVEGGAATLIVTPAGESVLIDCGWAGDRDAGRIAKAADAAGVKAIDHLIITHWHTDHYGGVENLSKLLPIRHFYDHGIPDSLADDPANFPLLIAAYKKASEGKSQKLKPGDEIALRQADGAPPVRLQCLSGGGEVIPDKPSAPENPVAKEHKPKEEDKSDNARSLGFLLSYGGFRFLDLGDLTWNIEYKLVAPSDKVGPIDVYQVTHHGADLSNNPVLLKTVRPRVAVMNNGPRKGGSSSVVLDLKRLEGLEAFYQLHRNAATGAGENADADCIANPEEKCEGEPIRLAVAPDGKSYTMTVGWKGKQRRFETRAVEK